MAYHLGARVAVLLVAVAHLIVLMEGNFTEGSMASRMADDFTAQVDAFVEQQMARHHVPGLALVITQGNSVLYSQGYGVSGARTPVTPQSQLYLASVSKSMTALAVVQLVEEGKVDLDAPVQRYLPEFMTRDAAASSRVTVRHLLNHTSGMADTGFPELRLPQMRTPAERVRSLRSARPIAAPGVEYHYFNPNYEILARLVEVVSGQPFSAYLAERIFSPLGMADTFHVAHTAETAQRAERLARGHFLVYSLPVAADEMSGYIGGSGGVISTAEDVAKFLIMQTQNGRVGDRQLIAPESLALMRTPPAGLQSDYGMGWVVRQENGRQILEHNGIFSAYYAEVVLLPEEEIGIGLLYNAGSLSATALAFPQIKNGLVALLEGRQPQAGGFSVVHWGLLTGLLTLVGGGQALFSLLRLPRWKLRAQGLPAWRLVPGIAWAFTPTLVLLGMPWLSSAGSGRVFGYAALWRSMPEVFLWLGTGAVFGLVNGALRLRWLARRR